MKAEDSHREREWAVLVRVIGTDEAGEKVTLSTRGQLSDVPGGFILRYEELNPDDLSTTQTFIDCREGRVIILRTGGVISTVVYEEKETFISEYGTSVGQFTLRVYTTEVTVKRRGSMGRVHLAYQVNLSSDLTPTGEMSMRWLDVRFTPCRQ